MNYKYKVGQAVRIRPDLKPLHYYYMNSGPGKGQGTNTVSPMLKYAGMIVRISTTSMTGVYLIREDNGKFYWTDEMFKDINPFVCRQLL